MYIQYICASRKLISGDLGDQLICCRHLCVYTLFFSFLNPPPRLWLVAFRKWASGDLAYQQSCCRHLWVTTAEFNSYFFFFDSTVNEHKINAGFVELRCHTTLTTVTDICRVFGFYIFGIFSIRPERISDSRSHGAQRCRCTEAGKERFNLHKRLLYHRRIG